MPGPYPKIYAANLNVPEPRPGDEEALKYLHQAIAQGKHWFIALLETIALWRSPEEEFDGRHYCYLVGGEAFDWLLLAERLCEELGDLVTQEEKERLLFFGAFPVEVEPWEFQRLIGRAKYRAYLNYWYGVLVEEALLLAAEERIAKEHHALGYARGRLAAESSYQWVYGAMQQDLLGQFQVEKGLPVSEEVSFAGSREFLYWCFKYRLQHRDPAKVASDTRLGLERLLRMRTRRAFRPYEAQVPLFDPVSMGGQ